MILYFYLNLGTSYLNTSSIWDEHLLEKYLPIESCQRWPYKTKLLLRTPDYLTGIAVTAAISLLSQLDCGHNNQWLNSVMELRQHPLRWSTITELFTTLENLCHLLQLPSQRRVKDNKNKPAITKTLIWDSRASQNEYYHTGSRTWEIIIF